MANVNKGAVDEIERILSALRSGEATPNWDKEISRISAFTKGDYVVRRIISDLWIVVYQTLHYDRSYLPNWLAGGLTRALASEKKLTPSA